MRKGKVCHFLSTPQQTGWDSLERKNIKVSKFFGAASPENTDVTKSISKVVSSYHFTFHQQNRQLGFLSDIWPKTQHTCKTISQHRGCDFHHFHPAQAPTNWFLGKNSWGAGNDSLPKQKGCWISCNGFSFCSIMEQAEKKTGKNNNHIPSKKLLRVFLWTVCPENHFCGLILSKPSHFLCQ